MSNDQEMHALVIYESMFGNTADVARAVADGLRAEHLTVDVVDVRDAPRADQVAADLIVVGAPTHAFSLSRPSTRADAVRQGAPTGVAATGLREWIDAVTVQPASDRRLAAAFDTRVTKVRRLPKAASTRAARLLSRHGYEIVGRPTPFLVEDLRGPLVAGEVDRARTWGRVIALAAHQRLHPTPAPAR